MFGSVLPCEERPSLTKVEPLSHMSRSRHTPPSARTTERLHNGYHAYRKLEVKVLYMSALHLLSLVLHGSEVLKIFRFYDFGHKLGCCRMNDRSRPLTPVGK
jgi:hypothetical protein